MAKGFETAWLGLFADSSVLAQSGVSEYSKLSFNLRYILEVDQCLRNISVVAKFVGLSYCEISTIEE